MTLGPKEKKERRLGERLGLKGDRCAGPKCAALRRAFPPGAHGKAKGGRPARLTGYGLQLREKQKAKLIYGLSERQFKNYVKKSMDKKGDSAVMLGQLLENRLDNVVYRLGLARSRGEARQQVSHGHFLVNGERLNVPSYAAHIGDVIAVKPKSAGNKFFQEVILPRAQKQELPGWLIRETEGLTGRVLALPAEEELPQNINRTMIIEFFSR